jgi:hypothetical protein
MALAISVEVEGAATALVDSAMAKMGWGGGKTRILKPGWDGRVLGAAFFDCDRHALLGHPASACLGLGVREDSVL